VIALANRNCRQTEYLILSAVVLDGDVIAV